MNMRIGTRHMRFHSKSAIIVSVLVLVLNGSPVFGSPQRIRIQLPWYISVEWAGIIMAKEKGFDKKLGIDLQIVEYASGIDPVKSVTSGRADMGLIDAPSIILNRARGEDIVAIWAQMQTSPLGICTLKENNIAGIMDLKGKRFGTQKEYEYLLDIILAKSGVSKKDINVVYITGDPVLPLENHDVDAVGCFDTYQAPILRIRGNHPLVIRASDVGLDFYEQVIFVRGTDLMKDALFRKTLKAITDGWVYALNNINETVGIIVTKYRPFNPKERLLDTKGKYIAHQKASLKLTHWYMTKGVGAKIGLMRRSRWLQSIDLLRSVGMINQDIRPEDIYTTKFLTNIWPNNASTASNIKSGQ